MQRSADKIQELLMTRAHCLQVMINNYLYTILNKNPDKTVNPYKPYIQPGNWGNKQAQTGNQGRHNLCAENRKKENF